jgi:hypothetical protein
MTSARPDRGALPLTLEIQNEPGNSMKGKRRIERVPGELTMQSCIEQCRERYPEPDIHRLNNQ